MAAVEFGQSPKDTVGSVVVSWSHLLPCLQTYGLRLCQGEDCRGEAVVTAGQVIDGWCMKGKWKVVFGAGWEQGGAGPAHDARDGPAGAVPQLHTHCTALS